MQKIKNILLNGSKKLPIPVDVLFKEDGQQKSVLIYAHGFKGFKDWGNFDLVANHFAEAGLFFVKFNFSHNGTSVDNPMEFTNLEAFGNNNYSIELDDLQLVIDWLYDETNPFHLSIDRQQIFLLGHSMGGGICILQAARDKRIKRLATWATIHQCKTPWGNWTLEKIAAWKTTGVEYYLNSRTNQQIPLYYQLYEDFLFNQDKLNIEKAMKGLAIPIFLCHGNQDQAVPVSKAILMKQWQPAATLFTLDTDHVFGRKHPWSSNEFPPATEIAIEKTVAFFLDE